MALLEHQVPQNFRVYVNEELAKEWMADEIDRVYGRTLHGQYFCFITSTYWWYAVRLVIDEEYPYLENQRERGVTRRLQGIVIKEDFLSREEASNFVLRNIENYENGRFNLYAFRVRVVPMDVHQNPDVYLKPGDHIQRNICGIKILSHDGVYLGHGKVAHYNNELNGGSSLSSFASSSSNSAANAEIIPFNEFVTSQDQEVRIVVHCFRRRARVDICETARRLVAENYGRNQYNLFNNNCQHYATLCVLGEAYRTDF